MKYVHNSSKILALAILFIIAGFLYVTVVMIAGSAVGSSMSLILPILGVVSFVVLYFIWKFPLLGLYSFAFIFPFDLLTGIKPGSSVTLIKILLIFLFVTWLIQSFTNKDPELVLRLKISYLPLAALLFVLFSLLSTVNAIDPSLSIFQTIRRLSSLVMLLLLINIIRTREIRDNFILAYVSGLFIASFSGIFEMITHKSFILAFRGLTPITFGFIENDSFRVTGMSGVSDFHALAMAIGILLTLYLILRHENIWARIIFIGMIVIFLINLLGTGARGGALMLLVGSFIALSLSAIKRKVFIGAIGASAILISFLFFVLLDTSGAADRYTGGSLGTFQIRIKQIEVALNMIEAHPVLGVGSGNYLTAYHRYTNPDSYYQAMFTHNSPLQAWAENGIFQFFIYLSLFLITIRLCLYIRKHSILASEKNFGAIMVGLIVGLFIEACTIPTLDSEIYWVIFALAVAGYGICKQEVTQMNASIPVKSS